MKTTNISQLISSSNMEMICTTVKWEVEETRGERKSSLPSRAC